MVAHTASTAGARQHRTAATASVFFLLLSLLVVLFSCTASAVTVTNGRVPTPAPPLVPESSSEQLVSRCECLLDTSCGRCTALNQTDCFAAVDCFWRDTTNQNKLATHTLEFSRPEVIQVTTNVFVAVGFGLANSILLIGPSGGVIIDTMESTTAAQAVMAIFRPLLNGLPIVGIIYTHCHSDHVYGTTVFTSNSRNVPIVAQRGHAEQLRDGNLVTGALWPRSQRQFGTFIPTGVDGHLNSGIGPALINDNTTFIGYMAPTIYFDDMLEINLGGLDFVLVNTPGETSDHAFVYVPEFKLGCVGDNIYKTFPNLYSIRGTRARSLRLWFNSIDTILDFNLDLLIGSHTMPILKGDEIRSVLTTYRDAIQYVHDQTLRQLNLGLNAEEIIDLITLPSYLANHSYLQQFYGTVTWGVRAVVDYYLGWFEGRASQLNPLPWRVQSKRLVALAGGAQAALQTAYSSMKENTVESIQWALQLGEAILYDDPNNVEARQVTSQSMRFLGYQQTSANGRNYLLSEASKIDGNREFGISSAQTVVSFVRLPSYQYIYTLPLILNTRTSRDTENFAVAYVFAEDMSPTFVIRVRREVAEIREFPSGSSFGSVDLTFYCSEPSFKTYTLFPDKIEDLLARGWVSLSPPPESGGLELLEYVESLFDPSRLRRAARRIIFEDYPELQKELRLN